MSANSASRHLRLAVSAAALLLASAQFDGSIVNAQPSADLDTLIMASLQNSGKSEMTSAANKPELKASLRKSAAAKKLAAKKRARKMAEPSVVQIVPQQGGGGLLSAIGAVGSGFSQPAADTKPLSSETSSVRIGSRSERSSVHSGSSVYVTSGYGQSESRMQPSLTVVQAPTFGFGSSTPAVTASVPDATEKLASNSRARKSGKAAPQQVAAVVAAPAVETPAQSSGISAFLATLGFGESAASPSSEAKTDSPLSASTSSLTSSSKSGPKERSKADIGATASIGNASRDSKSVSKSSGASSEVASSAQTPVSDAGSSVTASHVAVRPAALDRSNGKSSKSAGIGSHSKSGSSDQTKSDVAFTASIASSAGSRLSRAGKPLSVDRKAVPSIGVAESVPAPAPMPASPSGGLFAALGVAGGAESSPVETTAQIPVAYPEVVVVNRSVTMPQREMVMAPSDPGYRVDAGDKLRVVVYGQEGLTNTYAIDAGGGITMPLIGRVPARGQTPAALAADITGRLRKGFIREPSVAVEIEAYRPFFILGEVAAPGQYPYVPNMSVEAAVAIAGGFSPRARRDSVTLTHRADGGQYREAVPLGTSLSPGDTITVGERWF